MESKPGYKTTEFLLSLLAVLVSAIVGSGLIPEGHLAAKILGIITTLLVSLGYTASRTRVKIHLTKLRVVFPIGLLLGASVLGLALLCTGCCSTARCYLDRSLVAASTAHSVAAPIFKAVCLEKLAQCGGAPGEQCPAFQSCARALAIYQTAMDAGLRELGNVNQTLAAAGVK